MLKKQTVWLLTMLSLMIVLSVYYLTSDTEDLAFIESGESELEETTTSEGQESDTVIDEISNINDELFTTIRMEIQDERSRKKDRFNEIVASSSASAEEKNRALEDIEVLEQMTTKESILQDSIRAAAEGYDDVLVRAEEDKVHVHVKVDEMSKEEVINIMQMVKDEFGEVTVDVNFQPTNN